MDRERLVGLGSTIDYFGTAILPLALGIVLDSYTNSWVWLFPVTAAIGLISTLFLYHMPVPGSYITDRQGSAIKLFTKEHLWQPWKNSWKLLKERDLAPILGPS